MHADQLNLSAISITQSKGKGHVMELKQFDTLTRQVSGAGSSQQQALRAGVEGSGDARLVPS
jgi:hypothetical protein